MGTANVHWQLEPNLVPLDEGNELLIAEWRCVGALRHWCEAHSLENEFELQRIGVHQRRRAGGPPILIDPLYATLQRQGEDYSIASPSVLPQASTLLMVRGALAERLLSASAPVLWRLSAECSRLHALLLRACDRVQRQELAIALLCRLSGHAEKPAYSGMAASNRDACLADAMRQLMAASFCQPLTLETIARQCGSSAFHAARVFRRVTGVTLHRHLTQLRLRSALLRKHEFAGRLTELALTTGFSSHSHFSAAFKSEFGVSPSDISFAGTA